jgi:hypothetical protein
MTTGSAATPKPTKRRFLQLKWLVIISVTSLAILVSGGWWLSHRITNLNDVHVIMGKVTRHYQLPTDETPALATVTDSKKLQSNFSAKLHNDDKILIYENNKKAIVYRPSIDRVIDVEPVTVNEPTDSSTAIPDIHPFGN